MKSNTKSMLLTLVLVFMSSVGWGQACNEVRLKRDLKTFQDQLKVIDTACNKKSPSAEDDVLCKTQASKLKDQGEAQEALDECVNKKKDDEKFCTDTLASIDKGLEKFSYEDQKTALECMDGGLTTEADVTGSMLRSMGGNSSADPNTCSVDAAKSPYADVLQKQLTQVEKLEKEIKSIDEKIVKQKKDSTDQLADLNEDRIKLKEAWEKRQTEQEAEQARALNAMRENQIKVQEAIRKANAELINARQDMAKAERKRSEELLKAGVQSFSSMSRICNAQVKDYYKKAELNKKKKSGSLGSALGKGSSKKKDLQSFMDDCLKSMEEKRNAIYEDTTNYLVQMVNNIKDRQESITTLEGEYKNQADNYKKAIEREANALNKDQQAFLQKDQNLANKISQYQQNAAQEANQLIQQKMSAQQALSTAQNTKGKFEVKEVKEAIDYLQKHMSLVESLAGPGFDNKTGTIDMSKVRCKTQFARFETDVKEFSKHRKAISDNKGSQ